MTRLRFGATLTTTRFQRIAGERNGVPHRAESVGSVPKSRGMTGRAAIHSCSLVLAHAPDLVRHGSKPARELAVDKDGLLASLTGASAPTTTLSPTRRIRR